MCGLRSEIKRKSGSAFSEWETSGRRDDFSLGRSATYQGNHAKRKQARQWPRVLHHGAAPDPKRTQGLTAKTTRVPELDQIRHPGVSLSTKEKCHGQERSVETERFSSSCEQKEDHQERREG